mmetsp:Transcript_15666/g.23034  ORF Transcript_15666/g.23034 Transcript_15666/m.23034 type:complete len:206 (-) Transcript_15666:10-627(-)
MMFRFCRIMLRIAGSPILYFATRSWKRAFVRPHVHSKYKSHSSSHVRHDTVADNKSTDPLHTMSTNDNNKKRLANPVRRWTSAGGISIPTTGEYSHGFGVVSSRFSSGSLLFRLFGFHWQVGFEPLCLVHETKRYPIWHVYFRYLLSMGSPNNCIFPIVIRFFFRQLQSAYELPVISSPLVDCRGWRTMPLCCTQAGCIAAAWVE